MYSVCFAMLCNNSRRGLKFPFFLVANFFLGIISDPFLFFAIHQMVN